jgi:hypothetical protein
MSKQDEAWFEVIDGAGRKIASGPKAYCDKVAARKRGRRVQPVTPQPIDR